MVKYRRPHAGIGTFSVPLTLIDLAWLVTVTTLLSAKFGIVSLRLPDLGPVGKSSEASVAPQGIEVAIGTDGGLRLQGQGVVIDELGPRLKALGEPKRPLMISIDTLEDGMGHTDRLVQLVDHLQRAGVRNPLRVRAASSPKGITSNIEKGGPGP
jgi:biopolymer transport protein ExbD